MRAILIMVAFAAVFVGSPCAAKTEMHNMNNSALDGPIARQNLGYLITNMLTNEIFAPIDKLLAQWNNVDQRTNDGLWMLSSFTDGIGNLVTYTGDWNGAYKTLEDWRKENPKSPGLALTEAAYWNNYAWNARGHGYSYTVTDDGWKLYEERLEKAKKVLDDSKDYASIYPVWYELYLSVANSLDISKDKQYEILKEGLSKQKYYYNTYFHFIRTLDPKWGGSWNLVDSFINDYAKQVSDKEGESLYTRLYWAADGGQSADFDLFRDTNASWPRMKKGFEDMMKAFPESKWNLNNYASFACRANDKQTYQEVRQKIGTDVFPNAWRTNYSMDVCDHKYLTPL